MRLYRFDTLGSLDGLTLHDAPVPKPQRGEVLVRVRALSLNYRDLAVALGKYVWDAKAGLIPCSDAAGEIAEVGEGVTAWRPGDRVISIFHPRWFGGRTPATAAGEVYGSGQDGWLTEYKVVSQEALVAMPRSLSWEEAATLPCAAATAHNALTGQRPIRAGDSVLTLGSGGVSVFAIQLAKAFGARVIGTTSSEAKAETLRGIGVDAVVNYVETPDWGAQVKALHTGGIGVDCVVEVGGVGTIGQSLKAVRWGGEVVLVGFLTDGDPAVDYYQLKGAGAVIRPIGVGDRALLEDCVRAVEGAGIRPVIHRRFAFDEAAEAFAQLQSGAHVGKIVIQLED